MRNNIVTKSSLILFFLFLIIAVTSISGCTDTTDMSVSGQSVSDQSDTVKITDMLGRNLTVPSEIKAAITTYPPTTILVYMLAPDKLAGWNFMNSYDDYAYMNDTYYSLPSVGGWYGTTTGNYETIMNINPDVVIDRSGTDGQIGDELLTRQEMFGSLPVIAVDYSMIYVNESDPTIEYLGELLDSKEQAEDLIEFRTSVFDEINSKVSEIPDDEKARVYYAEGPTGLKTDPTDSVHSQVIELCGGVNVADCPLTPGIGMTEVSMEQIIEWQPEVIITSNAQFYSSVYSDSLWTDVDAVKNERVYLVPTNPFCWIDRPPGPHVILGTAWTAKSLYPELFEDMDMEQLTRDFYSQFFHYELTDGELNNLLYPDEEVQ
jgi:iron complex transport system substrate-binding protein